MWATWLLKESVFKDGLLKYSAVPNSLWSFQDGVLTPRSVSESLQISEGEAESGDSGSKLDFSGDSPSRPNSDIADVSLGQPQGFASLPLLCVLFWVTLCIQYPPKPFPYKKTWHFGLVLETGREIDFGVLSRIRLSWH